jgi:hypothetical protein
MKASHLSSLKAGFIFILLIAWSGVSGPERSLAQPPPLVPYGAPTPQNQRQFYEQLLMQLRWLQNATQSASMLNTAPDVTLFRQFDAIGVAFRAFTQTLTPWQAQRGANELADLDAGLSIIGEAFPNFQEDLNQGRSPQIALRTLCQVLREASQVWERQLRQTATTIRVGRI